MKIILIGILTVLLTACASVGQVQGECEAIYSKFKDIYNCSKPKLLEVFKWEKIDQTPDYQMLKLYLLEGEVLSEQIDKGEISEIEAKVKWQRLYLDLGSRGRDAPN